MQRWLGMPTDYTIASAPPETAPAASSDTGVDASAAAPVEMCDGCDAPQDECECVTCGRCERHNADLSLCENCDRCEENCCGCAFCEHCESHVNRSDYCNECDRCESCECECRGDFYVERRLKFWTAAKGDTRRNSSTRHIGVEIEVATHHGTESLAAVSAVAERWQCSIVEDGSLPGAGFELVTAPASGDAFARQIDDVTKAIHDAGGDVTKACGLHVHVDARDFAFYDMRRLVLLYAKVETALFATQPVSRRENTYCTPCGTAYANGLAQAKVQKESKAKLLRNVYETTFGGGKYATRPPRDQKYHGARYHALNLHSWMYRGTVECRLHTGTVNANKIIPWGMLWAAILDYAKRATEHEIEGLRFASLTDEKAFLLYIAPTDEVRRYLKARWNEHDGDSYPL